MKDECSMEFLHGIVGTGAAGMGRASKVAFGGTAGHRPGLFRMMPALFRRTPLTGGAAPKPVAGSCGPLGCST